MPSTSGRTMTYPRMADKMVFFCEIKDLLEKNCRCVADWLFLLFYMLPKCSQPTCYVFSKMQIHKDGNTGQVELYIYQLYGTDSKEKPAQEFLGFQTFNVKVVVQVLRKNLIFLEKIIALFQDWQWNFPKIIIYENWKFSRKMIFVNILQPDYRMILLNLRKDSRSITGCNLALFTLFLL